MIQNTPQARRGGIPRLAMFNSFAGYGRCSTTICLPVISVMQVQVCPVPTSVLSNHLGFPTCFFDDYTSRMREYLHAWEQLQVTFDGLYCGFLGSVEQIHVVEEFLDSPMMSERHMQPLFLLDPVMGDHGKTYSSITQAHCKALKELAARADILTPNLTEACLLTDTPYRDGKWTLQELSDMCEKLERLRTLSHTASSCHPAETGNQRPVRIVITGLQDGNRIVNFIWENSGYTTCHTQVAGAPHHGTGDLFASILAADALHEVPFALSVQKAADFVGLCIKATEEAGVPKQDGVLYEKYLSLLRR